MSHYQTAMAIRQALQEGDVGDAIIGIEELIEALSRSDKRALRSHLIGLMMHIVKGKSQSDGRSLSGSASIRNAREEIADIQEETRSLTEAVFGKCFTAAKREAEGEMNQKTPIPGLSWGEVFGEPYDL